MEAQSHSAPDGGAPPTDSPGIPDSTPATPGQIAPTPPPPPPYPGGAAQSYGEPPAQSYGEPPAQSYGQHPGFAPPVAPVKRVRVLVPILISLIVLLVITQVGLIVASTSSNRQLDSTLAAQKTQRTADASDAAAAKASQDALAIDHAVLTRKLQAVKDADVAVSSAMKSWQTVYGTKFGVVITAVDKCYYLANDYDVTAARLTDQQLNGLPKKIDLGSTSTDCGREIFGQAV